MSGEELIARATGMVLADQDHYHIYEAYPQPHSAEVVMGISPRWWRNSDKVPIFVDAEEVNRPMLLIAVPKRCTYEDLRLHLSVTVWPLNTRIVFEDRGEDFVAGQMVRPTEGSLFRVLPPHAQLGRVLDLDDSLQNLDWAWDVAVRGLPTEQSDAGRLLVIGPDHAFVTGSSSNLSFPNITRQVAIIMGAESSDLVIYVPRESYDTLTFRGRPVAGVMAVDFRNNQVHDGRGCGLFIDCRDLGIEVTFCCFNTMVLRADDFADILDFEVPSGYTMHLEGYENEASRPGHFLFRQGALVNVWLEMDVEASADDDSDAGPPISSQADPDDRDQGDDPDEDDMDFDDVEDEVLPAEAEYPSDDSQGRSRSPRRHGEMSMLVACNKLPSGSGCDNSLPGMDATLPTQIEQLMQETVLISANKEGMHSYLEQVVRILDNFKVGDVPAATCFRAIATPCRASLGRVPQLEETLVGPDTFVLKLNDFLGPQQHCIAKNCLQMIDKDDLNAIWSLILPWRDLSLGPGPGWEKLHQATQQALSICEDIEANQWPPVLEVYTDGSAKDNAAGFVVVLVGQWPEEGRTSLFGCFGGPVVTDPESIHYVRAQQCDAYNAEITAICWAVLWCIGHWNLFQRPWIVMRFDAQVAGYFASGQWETNQAPISEFTREIVRFLEHCIGMHSLQWRHTKAHDGQPWTEMADVVADLCMQGIQLGIPQPNPGWPFCIGNISMTWAALVPMSCASSALPLNADGQFCWEEDEGPLQPMAVHQVIPTTGDVTGQQLQLRIKAVSANVQTCIGKYKFFEEQLKQQGIDIFCVQEARSREGCTKSKDFIRFASDGQGHWGSEVWIARRAEFALLDGRSLCIDESCMYVRSSSPRHMHVEIDLAGHKLHVASLHFPQRNRSASEKAQHVQILSRIMETAGGLTCVIGMDANGRVPISFGDVTGDLFEDEEDENGRIVAAAAAEHQFWFPATFDCCQQGSGKTWTQSAGGKSRIDYFLISPDAPKHAVGTRVLEGFDLLTQNDDHDAIFLCLDFVSVKWRSCPTRLKRGDGLDIRCLREPETLAAFEDALDRSGVYHIPWDTDVNTHALWFQQAVTGALHHVLPRKKDMPRGSYIPDAAWRLRQQKVTFKRRTLHRKTSFKLHVCCYVMQVWNTSRREVWQQARDSIQKLVVLYELCAGAVQVATSAMRQLIKDKKNSLLCSLASKFGHTRPDEIMQQLKALHLGRRKQAPWRRTLPCLRTNDTIANSRAALDEIWLQHFGKMEYGKVVAAGEFLQSCSRFADADLDCQPELAAFPTIAEIETAFRATKCNKSPGLDLIHGEVLKWAPGRLAAAAFPLMCKASARRLQPVHWRGGVLAECYKGKGALADPAAYRSLYVSSMVGKAYHRIIRQKVAPTAAQFFDTGHFAAKRGIPVTVASLMIALFERWQSGLNQSAAILFLDIQSAYYSVIRQLAYGDASVACDDSQVCAVLKHFGLPSDVWQELISVVQHGGLMGQHGTTGHLRSLVKDAHDGSFFVTRYATGGHVCATAAGSRPGESLADLIYAWIFHAVLRDIKLELQATGALQKVPFTGEASPFSGPATEALDLLGPTWADDSSFACADREPEHLVHKTKLLVRSVVDQCARRGLIPNCKPGKTSIILSLRGKGSRTEQFAVFGAGDRHLEVETCRFGTIMVPVVKTYIHLGCAVEKGMSMATEAHRRCAIANTAFEPLQALVFQNTSIPAHVRGQLFSVFIDSTFFNLEVWRGGMDAGWKRLALGHQKLTRRVLARDLCAEEIHKLNAAEIACLTSHPPLAILHRSKRLRFAINLVNAAPPIVWALIQAEQLWGAQLLADLSWMRTFAGGQWPEVNEPNWPSWWHLLKESPGAFRRAVGKAVHFATLLFVSDGLKNAVFDSLHRGIAAIFPTVQGHSVTNCWFCPPCRMAFRSKANLACHFFKKHQRVARHRLYQGPVICPNCLHDYVDTHRMQMHLKKNPRCLQHAIEHGHCGGDPGPGFGSRAWKECRSKHPIFCPPVLVHKLTLIVWLASWGKCSWKLLWTCMLMICAVSCSPFS